MIEVGILLASLHTQVNPDEATSNNTKGLFLEYSQDGSHWLGLGRYNNSFQDKSNAIGYRYESQINKDWKGGVSAMYADGYHRDGTYKNGEIISPSGFGTKRIFSVHYVLSWKIFQGTITKGLYTLQVKHRF